MHRVEREREREHTHRRERHTHHHIGHIPHTRNKTKPLRGANYAPLSIISHCATAHRRRESHSSLNQLKVIGGSSQVQRPRVIPVPQPAARLVGDSKDGDLPAQDAAQVGAQLAQDGEVPALLAGGAEEEQYSSTPRQAPPISHFPLPSLRDSLESR